MIRFALMMLGIRSGVRAFTLTKPWPRHSVRALFGTKQGAMSALQAELPRKMNFLDLQKDDLSALLKSWGHPTYRSDQIWDWVTKKGAASFEDMGNVPKPLRTQLEEHLTIGSMSVAVEQVSLKDGTIKRAYQLWDGQLVEAVLMPYNDGRRTACISSQAGCGMGCTFCATGQMGFARHLSSTEIFEQAQQLSAELTRKGERLSNVVMMGMGEPLANYDNVLTACRRISSELGIGARHITISTVGVVPRIKQLALEPEQFTLAVSLHEASNEARSALMPVNRRFGIEALLEACEEYVGITKRRVTFEWALISGVNDEPEVAHTLGKLLNPLKGKCHVNLIPLNPTGGYEGKPANPQALRDFVNVLEKHHGVPATARVRRGIDIDAGCGQLTQSRKKADERRAAKEVALLVNAAASSAETVAVSEGAGAQHPSSSSSFSSASVGCVSVDVAAAAAAAAADEDLLPRDQEEEVGEELDTTTAEEQDNILERAATAAALGRFGVPSEETVAGGWG